jgi:hypothetical protein
MRDTREMGISFRPGFCQQGGNMRGINGLAGYTVPKGRELIPVWRSGHRGAILLPLWEKVAPSGAG